MASVQDVAVLVRYFMSAAVTIPPTITVRAQSIMPTIGGDRNDLSLQKSQRSSDATGAHFQRMQGLFRCPPLAKPIMFALRGRPKR
jgi:hypothetical protein